MFVTTTLSFFNRSTRFAIGLGLLSAAIGYGIGKFVLPISPQVPSPASATGGRPAETAVSDRSSHSDWEAEWEETAKQPRSPAHTRSRAAMLEALARTDPQRALALAFEEGNWLIRDQLRDAALRGWGAVAPDEAADWAMTQTILGERMRCVSAVLTGAVENPEAAVRVGLRVCAADPQPSGDYGHTLINALVDKAGAFDIAVKFATSANMVDRQSYLLDSAYYQWAQHEPDRALAQLPGITDPNVRAAALKGIVEGCAGANPEKLADYAQRLPEGDDRAQVLGVALTKWVDKNPEAALQWINRADPHPDYDRGVAALALLPSLVENRPEVAMDLTDNICDSARRTLTKSNVFYQWARNDPAAARKYAEATKNPEHRETLLADLASAIASHTP
jgi:hypothetical protein